MRDVTGGIARYKPVDYSSVGREALCSASLRFDNSLKYRGSDSASAREDFMHVGVLLKQAKKVAADLMTEEMNMFIEQREALNGGQLKELSGLLESFC